jgi:riboflavin kinase/FMN adenylyltransferase
MRVVRSPDEMEGVDPEQLTLTVGNFDGFHLGHQAVLAELLASAAPRGGFALAVTFEPHPVAMVRPERAPALLTTLDEKTALMSATGLAALLVVDFTRELMGTSAADFLTWLGVGRGSHMVLGYDFHMGRDRACDVGALSALGARLGYGLDVVPPVEFQGAPISSSRIRDRLAAGDVVAAADMLGRPYALSGRVVAGDGVGADLGAATANLALKEGKLLPADGVYFVTIPALAGRPGVLYVGTRPTFGEGPRRAEVHVLDLEGDLRGGELAVEVRRRLRGDRKFADPARLREQIRADLEAARAAALERGPAA